jgi:hypothetical protein
MAHTGYASVYLHDRVCVICGVSVQCTGARHLVLVVPRVYGSPLSGWTNSPWKSVPRPFPKMIRSAQMYPVDDE